MADACAVTGGNRRATAAFVPALVLDRAGGAAARDAGPPSGSVAGAEKIAEVCYAAYRSPCWKRQCLTNSSLLQQETVFQGKDVSHLMFSHVSALPNVADSRDGSKKRVTSYVQPCSANNVTRFVCHVSRSTCRILCSVNPYLRVLKPYLDTPRWKALRRSTINRPV